MNEGWFPLPFPECPGCSKAWVSTGHRSCPNEGEMEVEPWHERVRCDGCGSAWALRDSTFHCSCGRTFGSSEVDEALNEVVRATRSLYEEIKRKSAELSALERRQDASFGAWMAQVASLVGGAAGFVIGRLLRALGS